jgi:hypothetical protein
MYFCMLEIYRMFIFVKQKNIRIIKATFNNKFNGLIIISWMY